MGMGAAEGFKSAAIGWSYSDQDHLSGGRCFEGFKIEFIHDGKVDYFSHEKIHP